MTMRILKMDCLFCKIANGEIPAKIDYQDDNVVAFADINPQAPVHLLIIPRQHINTLNDLRPEELPIVGDLVRIAGQLAKKHQISEDGYRLVMNCNANGGQSVFHIHMHLLGGRLMAWPPG
jgi:histidine triad (HIT) family protein